ncbi:Druantia anti-phage system protein DruA, partial [Candidatus Magnetobacterium casense]
AVRHIGCRDKFIGWSALGRQKNLSLIAYNTRFLILPWLVVPHLGSHLLGRIVKVVATDWPKVYQHPIYFLETFVDKERFRGICYRAANWIYLGETTGRGKNDNTHKPNRSIKAVYGYPLVKDFQDKLCQRKEKTY